MQQSKQEAIRIVSLVKMVKKIYQMYQNPSKNNKAVPKFGILLFRTFFAESIFMHLFCTILGGIANDIDPDHTGSFWNSPIWVSTVCIYMCFFVKQVGI